MSTQPHCSQCLPRSRANGLNGCKREVRDGRSLPKQWAWSIRTATYATWPARWRFSKIRCYFIKSKSYLGSPFHQGSSTRWTPHEWLASLGEGTRTSYCRRSWPWGWSEPGPPLTPSTHRQHRNDHSELAEKTCLDYVILYIKVCEPECFCSDLVDAEVSHPENNRAGHELRLGALSGWRAEGNAGGGVNLTCGWRKKRWKDRGRGNNNENRMKKRGEKLSSATGNATLCKRCVSPHLAVRTHT